MADERVAPAAEGFGLVADGYERSRPSYPRQVIDVLIGRLGLGPGTRACDVGAGTGKLTRLLVAEGAAVVAVEPSPAMRSTLEAAVRSVTVVDATAERLPLADEDFDLVTVGQAFHWFRPTEALAEIARVLRPGGGLAIVDNDLDDRVAWVRELERITWPAGTPLPVPAADSGRASLLASAGFVDIGAVQIRWSAPATRASLAARVRSSSSVALEPTPIQDRFVEQVLAAVAELGEPFDMPYVTDVVWARRPGSAIEQEGLGLG